MRNRDGAVAALVLMAAWSVGAETATPEETAKTAAAVAAMERAKRQAAGPLRFIIEASKGRRKPGDPEPAPTTPPVESRPVSTVPPRASAPAVGVAPRSAVAVTLRQTSTPAPLVAAAEPAVAVPVAAPEGSAVATEITYNPQLRSPAVAAPVPALQTSGTASINMPAPGAVAVTPVAALTPASVQPKLLSRVDPEVTQRMLDDLPSTLVVLVELSLLPNGSVSNVKLLGSVPRTLQRALVAALEQWRFEPLPAARVHRVEVVFNNER